ncbi:YjbH domain-containing protein [Marinomonas agarivorans]|nr:YjbH domain-containing protein [Marinomonas agarivorans]
MRISFRHLLMSILVSLIIGPAGNVLAVESASDFFNPLSFDVSQMNLGGVGLIQVPSGRVAPEGDFTLGFSQNSEYDFYTASLQLLPWLETTLRYTQVEDVLYSSSEAFSGDTRYTDKGIDVKARLWSESRYFPEVSIGLKDIGGTGLFDGEYIAGSKRFYTDNAGHFDITLGLGWGYFGTRGNISNPLCSDTGRFCNRISSYSVNGGMIDYDRWFTGSTSLFGGIEYQTLYQPLSLKLEYEGNDYSQDFPAVRANVDMTPKTPWNFGAVYSISDSFDMRLSYERGTTLTVGFGLNTNFDTIKTPWLDHPIPKPDAHRPSTLDKVNWQELDNELRRVAGYSASKVYIDGDTAKFKARQRKYRDRDIALEKAAAILHNKLPDSIRHYQIHEGVKNMPMRDTNISVEKYKEFADVTYINPHIQDAVTDLKARAPSGAAIYDNTIPYSFGFKPHLNQSFGGPESFYLYSLSLNGAASYWFNDDIEFSAGVSVNLHDNYDKIRFNVLQDGTSNYRVRTLVRAYVRDNDVLLSNLQLTWYQKYGQNFYQQVYGGYLETMFAGIGTEVLYRRPNSNWAIGVDHNVISQRDPNSVFDVFENDNAYSSSDKVLSQGTTGHLSLYYMPKWTLLEDTLLRVDMGKFLAGDIGARFDFSRQYKSGVIVGAYASKTNLSAEEFGEGSFTKGFYLSIPFDTLSYKPTVSRAGLHWQPLTRDGGQMLGKRNGLFSNTDLVSPWYQRPNQNK